MTNFLNTTLTILSMLVSLQVNAKWYQEGKHNISLDIKHPYKVWPRTMGVPFLITGPKKDTGRLSVTIVEIPLPLASFDKKYKDVLSKYYINNRKKWLKKFNSTPRSFDTVKSEKWSKGHNVLSFGVKYDLGGYTYKEKSHYVTCKNKIYNIKAVFKDDRSADEYREIESNLKGFDCK